ncbi:MAG: scyllo-inositol 2-dehydrogenase [Solirubrobacteraceae bacterium]|nr:scyllo-inositol 2-dehydrogenase [Solirubrobacteraceae bacterium]
MPLGAQIGAPAGARYGFPVEDLRVAIVGYGLAGRTFHAALISSTPGLAVAAVVVRSAERQELARRDHPEAQVVASLDEVWDARPDLVVVAAPNHLHVPMARAAVDRGVAVVVDKPLAPTAEEARSLVAHARERGVLLTAFHNRRWDSDQLTLRRLLREGELGDVLRFESRFERWRPEMGPETKAWRDLADAPAGGILLDLAPHLVDQALTLFGPVEHVYAEIDARRGGADDDVFLALRHRDGVTSHLWASAVAAAPGPRLRVLGTRGAYVVDAVDSQEDALRAGARPGAGEWGVEPPERWGRLVRGEESTPVPSEAGNWPAFYAGVERALRTGGPPPVDPADAVTGLEILDAARRSAAGFSQP